MKFCNNKMQEKLLKQKRQKNQYMKDQLQDLMKYHSKDQVLHMIQLLQKKTMSLFLFEKIKMNYIFRIKII